MRSDSNEKMTQKFNAVLTEFETMKEKLSSITHTVQTTCVIEDEIEQFRENDKTDAINTIVLIFTELCVMKDIMTATYGT